MYQGSKMPSILIGKIQAQLVSCQCRDQRTKEYLFVNWCQVSGGERIKCHKQCKGQHQQPCTASASGSCLCVHLATWKKKTKVALYCSFCHRKFWESRGIYPIKTAHPRVWQRWCEQAQQEPGTGNGREPTGWDGAHSWHGGTCSSHGTSSAPWALPPDPEERSSPGHMGQGWSKQPSASAGVSALRAGWIHGFNGLPTYLCIEHTDTGCSPLL